MKSIVLIGTIVESQRLSNLADIQKKLETVFNSINRKVENLNSHFTICLGDEFKAGRIISIIEKVIIFIFVIANQYAAMGLVIAAKAFARFKVMDEKSFAEYVLIGNLLTAPLSLLAAVTIKSMLN
jgi:hypothetical protein